MNKQIIDKWIPEAYEILSDIGIASDGKIIRTYRSQLSTFGAAVMNGSLLAAISFFSDDAGASVQRTLITKAIFKLISKDDGKLHSQKAGNIREDDKKALFLYVREKTGREQAAVKENILNATIALKLAMNLYQLVDGGI